MSLLSQMMDTSQAYVRDPSTMPASDGFATPANGWYKAVITDSEVKTSKAGNQGLLQRYTLEVPNGVSKFASNWFNLVHPTDTVQRIAQEQLHSARVAIGQPMLSDEKEFLNRELMIKVKRVPATEYTINSGYANNDGFEISVVDFKAIEGAVPMGNPLHQGNPLNQGNPLAAQQQAPVPTPASTQQFNWQKQ